MAALYFDKLRMLSPFDAHVEGIGYSVHTAEMEALGDVLELVSPSNVVSEHRELLTRLIREDLADPAFIAVCDESGRETWQISLAKIPGTERDHELAAAATDPATMTDHAMRMLLRDNIRAVVADSVSAGDPYAERLVAYDEYTEVYDEYRETTQGVVEYRVVDLPMAVGESLLLNHALLGSVADPSQTVTPIADQSIHRRAMRVKLDRLFSQPEIRRQFGAADLADHLAVKTMQETTLSLPALADDVPLELVLELRQDRAEELAAARRVFAGLAEGIDARPWDGDEYQRAVDRQVDELKRQLATTKQAIDSWAGERRRLPFQGAGTAFGLVATAVPLMIAAGPLNLVAAGAGLLAAAAGAAGLVPDLLRRAPASTGLEYLLQAP